MIQRKAILATKPMTTRGSSRIRLVITCEEADPRIFEIVTAQHSDSAITNAISAGVKAFNKAFVQRLERAPTERAAGSSPQRRKVLDGKTSMLRQLIAG